MSEITAKDWGKAKYRSGGRGRGRGRRGRGPAELGGAWRRDTGSDDEEADEEGEGHAHGSDDDMQFSRPTTTGPGGQAQTTSRSRGADLTALLADAEHFYGQAYYRQLAVLQETEASVALPSVAGAEQDLVPDLDALAACLAHLPLDQLLGIEPEYLEEVQGYGVGPARLQQREGPGQQQQQKQQQEEEIQQQQQQQAELRGRELLDSSEALMEGMPGDVARAADQTAVPASVAQPHTGNTDMAAAASASVTPGLAVPIQTPVVQVTAAARQPQQAPASVHTGAGAFRAYPPSSTVGTGPAGKEPDIDDELDSLLAGAPAPPRIAAASAASTSAFTPAAAPPVARPSQPDAAPHSATAAPVATFKAPPATAAAAPSTSFSPSALMFSPRQHVTSVAAPQAAPSSFRPAVNLPPRAQPMHLSVPVGPSQLSTQQGAAAAASGAADEELDQLLGIVMPKQQLSTAGPLGNAVPAPARVAAPAAPPAPAAAGAASPGQSSTSVTTFEDWLDGL